jgi:hypothetical protein
MPEENFNWVKQNAINAETAQQAKLYFKINAKVAHQANLQ